MRKKLLLPLLLLLPAVATLAQSPLLKAAKDLKKHRQFIGHLLHQTPAYAAKTTNAMVRVIAEAHDDHTNTGNYGGTDSVTLKYSGSNASTYSYNDMDYDLEYSYDGSPMFDYQGHNNKPMVLCDSLGLWANGPNNGYGLQEQYAYTYDGNANLLTLIDNFVDSATESNTHFVNAFDGNNNVTYSLELTANGNFGYDSALQIFYTYDGQNRLVADTLYSHVGGVWTPYVKYTYQYNNNNLAEIDEYGYDNNAWDTIIRFVLTYSNNQMQKVEGDFYTNGAFETELIDSFGYTNGVDYHTYWKEYEDVTGNGTLDSVLTMVYHLNGQNLPDYLDYGTLDNNNLAQWDTFKVQVAYNASNAPTSLNFYQYHNNVLDDTAQLSINYYYETYFGLNVANVQGADNIKVYPNPTTGIVNVQLNADNPATGMAIRLINATGKTVQTQTVAGAKAQVSLSGLPSGMYWLMLQDNNGNTVYKQSIVKE